MQLTNPSAMSPVLDMVIPDDQTQSDSKPSSLATDDAIAFGTGSAERGWMGSTV